MGNKFKSLRRGAWNLRTAQGAGQRREEGSPGLSPGCAHWAFRRLPAFSAGEGFAFLAFALLSTSDSDKPPGSVPVCGPWDRSGRRPAVFSPAVSRSAPPQFIFCWAADCLSRGPPSSPAASGDGGSRRLPGPCAARVSAWTLRTWPPLGLWRRFSWCWGRRPLSLSLRPFCRSPGRGPGVEFASELLVYSLTGAGCCHHDVSDLFHFVLLK